MHNIGDNYLGHVLHVVYCRQDHMDLFHGPLFAVTIGVCRFQEDGERSESQEWAGQMVKMQSDGMEVVVELVG